jgi:hypothetical protein
MHCPGASPREIFMLFRDAQRLLTDFLAPFDVDRFLDEVLVGGFRRLVVAGAGAGLLGPDPRELLGGAVHLAPKLSFHSANPSGPPPSLNGITGPGEFRRCIDDFHARNYSVRFPELRPLAPPVDRVARALEVLLHKPVTASAFWSRSGMRAPVHFDDHDILAVQLIGTKRWLVSRGASELNNTWPAIPGKPPDLGDHDSLDLSPGDLLYLPRGTLHSVDGSSESVHVSLGFTPLTLREALLASLDHLSDLDRPLRATLGGRLAFQLMGSGIDRLGPPIHDAAARLLAACRTPGFIAAALQRRSSRAVAALAPLTHGTPAQPLTLDSALRWRELAFCHLTANAETIDFSYPGGHLYIHRGAEEAALFIANQAQFRVRDIPGAIGDDVRLSLAARFIEAGFLEPAGMTPAGPTGLIA